VICTEFDDAPATSPSAIPERLAERLRHGPPATESVVAASLGAMFDAMIARGVPLSAARACLAEGLERGPNEREYVSA